MAYAFKLEHTYPEWSLQSSNYNFEWILTYAINIDFYCLIAYLMLFGFSEKTLKRNSPSSLGSKVDGTITYAPGLSLHLVVTSRVLGKLDDPATGSLYLK
jgi:hypothetical protein